MTEARTIELLLLDGKAKGLLKAELSKWNGTMLVSPRRSLTLLLKQPETNFSGIFWLLNKNKLFIGRTENLTTEIKEKSDSFLGEEWWTKTILFSSSNSWLNKNQIHYLENKIIDKSENLGSHFENKKSSANAYKISQFEEIKLNDFLEGVLILTELLAPTALKNKEIIADWKIKNQKNNHNINLQINFSSSNRLDKKGAISLLHKAGINIKNYNIVFASKQKTSSVYWANPPRKISETDFILLLSDWQRKKLHIFRIGKNSLKTSMSKEKTGEFLHVRMDNSKPNAIDIQIYDESFVDRSSWVKFMPFFEGTISYE